VAGLRTKVGCDAGRAASRYAQTPRSQVDSGSGLLVPRPVGGCNAGTEVRTIILNWPTVLPALPPSFAVKPDDSRPEAASWQPHICLAAPVGLGVRGACMSKWCAARAAPHVFGETPALAMQPMQSSVVGCCTMATRARHCCLTTPPARASRAFRQACYSALGTVTQWQSLGFVLFDNPGYPS